MIKGELELITWSREGDKICRRRQPMRSFVRQFIDILAMGAGNVNTNIQDITDTTRLCIATSNAGTLNIMAPGGGHPFWCMDNIVPTDMQTEDVGIVIGTGDTAPTADDYALETKIAHGQAATEMVYGGMEAEPIVVSAPSASFILRRYFNNKSGGGITVKEVGLYCSIKLATTHPCCIARDVLGAPVAVADTELLRVQYTISVTV